MKHFSHTDCRQLPQDIFGPKRLVWEEAPENRERQEAIPKGESGNLVDEAIQIDLKTDAELYTEYKPKWAELFTDEDGTNLRPFTVLDDEGAPIGTIDAEPANIGVVDSLLRNGLKQVLELKIIREATLEERELFDHMNKDDVTEPGLQEIQQRAITALSDLGSEDANMADIARQISEMGPMQANNALKIKAYLKQKEQNEIAQRRLLEAKTNKEQMVRYKELLSNAIDERENKMWGITKWVKKTSWGRTIAETIGGAGVVGTVFAHSSLSAAAAATGAAATFTLPVAIPIAAVGLTMAYLGAKAGLFLGKGRQKEEVLKDFEQGHISARDLKKIISDPTTRASILSMQNKNYGSGLGGFLTRYFNKEKKLTQQQEMQKEITGKVSRNFKGLEKDLKGNKKLFEESAKSIKSQLDYYENMAKTSSSGLSADDREKLQNLQVAYEYTQHQANIYTMAQTKLATDADLESREVANMFWAEYGKEKGKGAANQREDLAKKVDKREHQGKAEITPAKTTAAITAMKGLRGADWAILKGFINFNRKNVLAKSKVGSAAGIRNMDNTLVAYMQTIFSMPRRSQERKDFLATIDAYSTEVSGLETALNTKITSYVSGAPNIINIQDFLSKSAKRATLFEALKDHNAAGLEDNIKTIFTGTIDDPSAYVATLKNAADLQAFKTVTDRLDSYNTATNAVLSNIDKSLTNLNASVSHTKGLNKFLETKAGRKTVYDAIKAQDPTGLDDATEALFTTGTEESLHEALKKNEVLKLSDLSKIKAVVDKIESTVVINHFAGQAIGASPIARAPAYGAVANMEVLSKKEAIVRITADFTYIIDNIVDPAAPGVKGQDAKIGNINIPNGGGIPISVALYLGKRDGNIYRNGRELSEIPMAEMEFVLDTVVNLRALLDSGHFDTTPITAPPTPPEIQVVLTAAGADPAQAGAIAGHLFAGGATESNTKAAVIAAGVAPAQVDAITAAAWRAFKPVYQIVPTGFGIGEAAAIRLHKADGTPVDGA